MTVIADDILSDLLSDEFVGFEGGNDQYVLASETTTIKANEWIMGREQAVVAGVQRSFDVKYRFINPLVSSIALRATNPKNRTDGEPRIDFNATIVAKREFQLMIGGEWHNLDDVVMSLLRKGSGPNFNRSDDEVWLDLASYGFDLHGEVPMYLQHLGASQEAFEEVAADFAARGGVDNTAQVLRRSNGKASRVLKSLRHLEGVRVQHLEISKADRSRNQNGTGFIGFFDATWGTLTQILAFDRERSAIDKAMAEAKAAGDTETRQALAERERQISDIFTISRTRRAFHNWGGTNRVVDQLEEDKIQYYAQQVPCGRFSVGADADSAKTYSVWGSKAATDALPEVDASTGGDEGMALGEIEDAF